MLENRSDLLELTLVDFSRIVPPVKVLIAPEDWDQLYDAGLAYIDETNKERAIAIG